MMAYASTTTVSVEKSEAEIKGLLRKRGADAFHFGEDRERASIAFQMDGRRVIFRLPLPDKESREFALDGRGATRSRDARLKAWEQACRSKWRALFLCIKAKLESVESGIETFEEAFLPHIMLPDGSTVADHTKPAIESMYQAREMAPLLPAPR